MPHSPAQLSSQRSLPEPPSSPPHSPSQNPPSLRIPALIPDPICPLPNSLPPTPPHTRFLPARILGSISLFPRIPLQDSTRTFQKLPRGLPIPCQADGASEDSLHLDIQKLKEKRDLLDTEISQLISEGYSVDELEDHISQLHEYNDIKDVGQMLLGKLAVIRGVTTKELYAEFGLDMND
uniref:DNA repair protein SWI5 homolog n=1 Tax=Felis catus TaxID=9685 RepID=A0ABI8ADW1_FELCA